MFTRAMCVSLIAVTVAANPAAGQLSGRVVVREGPIAVDVVFGPRYTPGGRHGVVYREARAPVRRPARYRSGMTLWELERYLERIELEYRLFRQLDPRDAYYDYGWTPDQLRDYVRFLRDERRFLRAERDRLHRIYRADGHRLEHPGRGADRGRGWGRGRGRGGRAGRGDR